MNAHCSIIKPLNSRIVEITCFFSSFFFLSEVDPASIVKTFLVPARQDRGETDHCWKTSEFFFKFISRRRCDLFTVCAFEPFFP